MSSTFYFFYLQVLNKLIFEISDFRVFIELAIFECFSTWCFKSSIILYVRIFKVQYLSNWVLGRILKYRIVLFALGRFVKLWYQLSAITSCALSLTNESTPISSPIFAILGAPYNTNPIRYLSRSGLRGGVERYFHHILGATKFEVCLQSLTNIYWNLPHI